MGNFISQHEIHHTSSLCSRPQTITPRFVAPSADFKSFSTSAMQCTILCITRFEKSSAVMRFMMTFSDMSINLRRPGLDGLNWMHLELIEPPSFSLGINESPELELCKSPEDVSGTLTPDSDVDETSLDGTPATIKPILIWDFLQFRFPTKPS